MWGPAAVAELRRLAKLRSECVDASRTGDPEQVRRAALTRWRRELSCAVMQSNAVILLSAAPHASLGGPGRCHAAAARAPALSELLVEA
eukprot:11396794-Karenia_brevis.AAC.1